MEISILIAVIVSLIGTATAKFFRDKEKMLSESKSMEREIENLDGISKSLNGLQQFIDTQKRSLIENEKILLELEKRKEELKPLVETQERTVEAILKAHTDSQKKSRRFDYLIGFFIGVASSATVALVFYYLQN